MILRVSAWIKIMRAMILLGVCRDIDRDEDYVQKLSFWGLKNSETLISRVFAEEQQWEKEKESKNEMNVQW